MKTKAERDAEKMTHCFHFNGVQNEKCRAGVRYQDVSTVPEWKVTTVPCWSLCAEAKCEHLSLWTPERIAERDEECRKSFERVVVARTAIVAHTGGKRGVTGAIDCPVCGSGKLRFSVASYNGHIHAACTTDGCARWME